MPSVQEDIAEIHQKLEEREEAHRRVATRVKLADAAAQLHLDYETLRLLCSRREIPITFSPFPPAFMLEAADVERLTKELDAERPAQAEAAPSLAVSRPAATTPPPAAAVLQSAPELSEAEQVQARVNEILAFATPPRRAR